MPDWQEYVRARLPRLTVSPEREHEIVAELALQIEQAFTGALAGGASEAEALRQAHSQIRDWQALACEINRAERTAPPPPEPSHPFSGSAADVRYALRYLRRNPAFAAIAIVTLAFGIGGNTAIFTLVDSVVLRGLLYRDPARLMAIETRNARQPEVEPWTSAPDLVDMRDGLQSFSDIAAISPIWNHVLSGSAAAERVESLFVSARFFPMLGVTAERGRTFTAQEDHGTAAVPVVVLSHRFAERRFGSTDRAVGQSLTLDGVSCTVVGVLPPGFRYMGEPVAGTVSEIEVWRPLASNPLIGAPRSLRFLKLLGRLKPGVSVERARSEVAAFGTSLAQRFPASNQSLTAGLQPLTQEVTGKFRVAMLLLLGTVGFVLLMTCANVANLLLARAAGRGREVSVRVALGASRFRLLRQMLTEGLVLAAMGGVAGLAVAFAGVAFLVRTGPETLVRAWPMRIDTRALLFTMAAVLLAALLAGLPPAWRMLGGDVIAGLREAGRGLTAGSHRLRSALVVLQVSVALALLVGAGLLVHSFQRLLEVDPGFQPRNLTTISAMMSQAANTPSQRIAIWRQFHDQLLTLPGVTGVAAVNRLPLGGSSVTSTLLREGRVTPGQVSPEVEYRTATPGYFGVMGIPLRAGRLFDEHDDPRAYAVAVIDEAAARRFWPGEDPVGSRIKLGPQDSPWITVVGVVGSVRHTSLETEPPPEVYRPYAASPMYSPILVIRTAVDSAAMRETLAAKLRSINPGVSIYNVYDMQDLVDRSVAQRRFVMLLVGGFAALALLLAAVGIYGAVSYAVTQRTSEIGLRMALGASPAAALSLVFRDGLRLTLGGIAIGATLAAGITHWIRKLLFEVRPLDPVAFAGAAILLGCCALAACYIPARRATRIDPIAALRQDH